MSDLVFIAFASEEKAEEVRKKILAMQKEYLIELGDAVVAVKDADGQIKLNQLVNMTAAGAASGAYVGNPCGLHVPYATSRNGDRCRFRCARWKVDGFWHQRSIYERRCLRPATRGCRALLVDPEDDDRQSFGGPSWDWRHRNADIFYEAKETALREALRQAVMEPPTPAHGTVSN